MKITIYSVVIISLIGLMFSSCMKDTSDDQLITGATINRHFYIEYINADGVKLLQNDSQIQVSYKKDGVAEIVQRSYLDCPNGYALVSQLNTGPNGSDELCVKVFSSDYDESESMSTTYVKFGNNLTDTFQCQFNKTPNAVYIVKIWLNGTIVWDKQTATSVPFILITK